ncbi:glycosyltransferase family 39 protein [Nafulsella turpanensis]|uniref:glycosyltransferase family 39 protein n=1 Tax=Nafulsella turpanensis TaxID=1265690 RepID=UPI0003455D4D|nr:glycosyltransferase family 39 protein [Nafulsella turpanensis]
MFKRSEHYNYVYFIFLLATAALLPHWAFHLPVASSVEKEIITVAGAMAASGSWTLPSSAFLPGSLLPYWLATAGHLLLPEGFLGYRMFFILISLCGLFSWYYFMRDHLGHQVGAFCIGIFIACLPLSSSFFQANPFSLATIFIATSLFSFYAYLKKRESYNLWILYGSLALGTLSTSPLLLLLPLLIIIIYLMFKIKMTGKMMATIRAGRGMLAVFLIILPCYLLALPKKEVDMVQNLFLATSPTMAFAAGEAFYLPLLFLLGLLLPFAGFLPKAFAIAWKWKVKKDLLMLICLALLTILLWYMLSEEVLLYQLLPATPYAVMATGFLFSQQTGRSWKKMGINFGSACLLIISLAVVAGLLFYLPEGLENNWFLWVGCVALLLGLGSCFFLWSRKQTDLGLFILCFSFFLFNACLMEAMRYQPQIFMEATGLF